jgi:HTH-type transcriptional repressor of NAD biosynthesis genes
MKVGVYAGEFLPWYSGHFNTAIIALAEVDYLYIVVTYDEKADENITHADGCSIMHPYQRLGWVYGSFKGYPNVNSIGIPEFNWKSHEDFIESITDKNNEIIVFNNKEAYVSLLELNPNIKYQKLDDDSTLGVTETQIRRDPFKYWEYIPWIVKPHFVKKILITGDEGVGKTRLTRKLAHHFNTTGIVDSSKFWRDLYGNNLSPEIFNVISCEHWTRQTQSLLNCNKYLFVDTDAVVSNYYLTKKCNGAWSPLIDEIAKFETYDQILWISKTPWTDRWDNDNHLLQKMYLEIWDHCETPIVTHISEEDKTKQFEAAIKALRSTTS